MSQDFNDPEIFADFIIESKEHLETIEPNLLELEKAPENLSLINEIFRPMHSLKGASGFMGLNRINVLAHRAENVLDELRKGVMPITSEIMDVILSATDALRQMIDSLESSGTEGDVESEPIIARLDAIMAGESHAAAAPAKAAVPAPAAPASPAPAAKASAAPAATSGGALSPAEWIAARPKIAPYTLTSFGQEHLKDFIEEARENVANISDGLLMLERNPQNQSEIVNDTFRYFHNIKGNSGIIGYQEVNGLTHEAETLLNQVRKGEMNVSPALVDLLLLVSDTLTQLFSRIDVPTAKASPFDASELLAKLQQATAGGPIELPAGLGSDSAPAQGPAAPAAAPAGGAAGAFDQDFAGIKAALAGLKANGADTALAQSLRKSLLSIRDQAGKLGLNEVKIYAERTAGIVEQGLKTNMDFAVMVDLLEQECSIIEDMLKAAPGGAPAAPAAPAEAAPASPSAPAPSPAKAPAPTPAPAKPAASASGGGASAKAPVKDEGASKASSTIRVDHEKLDHLMQLIGELIINRNRYAMIARDLENSDKEQVDVSQVAQNLSETTYSMGRISDELQDTIMKVRMVPVSSVFSRFPRLVRDLSRKSGKDVDLITEGEETELDKSVVEAIGDPLVHLIRNSVDHGVEDAETRKAAGKDPKGRVWLRAYHRGNSVAIEIEDDGRGIDPKKMRDIAVRKGIATQEEVNALDDREAVELIFAPGFSGAEKVTDISGRGVGMDVVRTNIKNLKGTVNINTEVGKGSTFTLLLPLTLAIIDALMVNVDGGMYAIPLDAVSETTKIESRRLTDVKGRKAVTLRGEVLGIVSLAELLGLKSNMDEQEVLSVVVIHDNDRHLGLVVDRLLERQEVVIKPLGAYLGDVKGISGATIMGDGSVILIMDPHELYLMATSKAL